MQYLPCNQKHNSSHRWAIEISLLISMESLYNELRFRNFQFIIDPKA